MLLHMKEYTFRLTIILIALLNEAIWFSYIFSYINDTLFMLICVVLFIAYIMTLLSYKSLVLVKNKAISLESTVLLVYLLLMAIPAIMLPLGLINSYLNSLSSTLLLINYGSKMLSILNPGILLIFINAYYLIIKRKKAKEPK